MALTFNHDDLPACCGIGLVPGDPHTVCPICFSQFNTQELASEIRRLKSERKGTRALAPFDSLTETRAKHQPMFPPAAGA